MSCSEEHTDHLSEYNRRLDRSVPYATVYAIQILYGLDAEELRDIIISNRPLDDLLAQLRNILDIIYEGFVRSVHTDQLSIIDFVKIIQLTNWYHETPTETFDLHMFLPVAFAIADHLEMKGITECVFYWAWESTRIYCQEKFTQPDDDHYTCIERAISTAPDELKTSDKADELARHIMSKMDE
jgi:hypothetical protein